MCVTGVGGWMADEYIKRSDAIKAVDNLCHVYFPANKAKLEAIPAEDVAPVVHGKWENQSPVFCWNKYGVYQTAYKCSVCGEMTPIDYNICPWCSARMDGE